MKKLMLGALLAVLFFSQTSLCAADPAAGQWKVVTTLVEAQDATNPDYQPGDKRIERWRIKIKGKTGTLKTPSGLINGAKAGKAWVFDQTYDTGYGVLINLHIVARSRGVDLIKGTIEARYYSTQFGYEIGVDAWSFKGTRL